MAQRRNWKPPVEYMTDMEIIVQAFTNTGDFKTVNEIKRLLTARKRAQEAHERQRQREFALHLKKTGVKHPNDDIPF